MRLLLCWLLLLGALPVQAEVYTYVDADGNRVFTDRPGNAPAERMELKAPNSMNAEPAQSSRRLSPEPPPSPHYDQLNILSPGPDTTLRNTAELTVTVSSEPALMHGHRYRLLVDGQTAGDPRSETELPLGGLHRGTHQLAVEILDDKGATLKRSATQALHVRLTTLNDKRRVNPCKKDDYGVRPECPLKDKPIKRNIPFIPFI